MPAIMRDTSNNTRCQWSRAMPITRDASEPSACNSTHNLLYTKPDRVPARFSVVSVQDSELPEVQSVASVLSLLGHVPVRSQALDRPILHWSYPIRSQGWDDRFDITLIPKLDATDVHYWFLHYYIIKFQELERTYIVMYGLKFYKRPRAFDSISG